MTDAILATLIVCSVVCTLCALAIIAFIAAEGKEDQNNGKR